MKNSSSGNQRVIHVKNMVCGCCVKLLRIYLTIEGVEIHDIQPGTIILSINPEITTWEKINAIIEGSGFEIIRNREKILVEQIKQSIIDLVYNTTYNAMVRNSDYLVERFRMSYSYITALFSKHEKTTLEKFIIQVKIEKVKELIETDEMTLSEIAYLMGYSSVQYLSTQFKAVTGISVTEYKSLEETSRKGLDNLNDDLADISLA